MSDYPPYVENRGGDPSWQPFACKDTQMYGFFVPGDGAAIQNLLDRALNEPTGGACEYRALSSHVMVTFAESKRLYPTTKPIMGWVPERSATIWVFAAAVTRGPLGVYVAERLAVFPAYVFVDIAWSLAMGREVYGFPKQMGPIALPPWKDPSKGMSATTMVLPVFKEQQEGITEVVLSVEQVEKGGAPTGVWSTADAAARFILERFNEGAGHILPGLGFAENLVELALHREVPCVFLKQFRDVADGTRACYQSIVEAPMHVTGFNEGGPLFGSFRLNTVDYASCQIMQDLGLTAKTTPVTAGFYLDFDFTCDPGHEVWKAGTTTTAPGPRRKIAILGGGVGAMTTAYELTEAPDWRDRYDITVYQLGWRLGGKGASGRNREMCDRIEEHGLHLWFGYYENAFNLMQRCYQALGRRPGEPLATWKDAFQKQSLFVVGEFHDGQWTRWPLMAPEAPGVPGDGNVPPLWEILDWVLHFVHRHFEAHCPADVRAAADGTEQPGWLGWIAAAIEREVAHLGGEIGRITPSLAPLHAARAALARLRVGTETTAADLETVLRGCEEFLGVVRSALDKINPLWPVERTIHQDVRRLFEIIELCLVTLKGLIADDVVNKGFDQLDELDLREWLAKHGASSVALDADLLRVAYETIFAYRHGYYMAPNLAAGTALRGLIRLCFTYKGAIAWKMQAGMGDTVFAPLYLVLKQRGVRFEFFNRVRSLTLSPDGTAIDGIQIGVQATTPEGKDYDPLYSVRDLPCWPSTPLYEQLVQGDQLRLAGIDLESYTSQWPDVSARALVRGRDFDDVVFGISIGAVPYVCGDLLEKSPAPVRKAWKKMVEHVRAVPTQAFQLWLRPDLHALGWDLRFGGRLVPPVVGGFAQPQNTYADMSHLIVREGWPLENVPGSIAYFCGPLSEPEPSPGLMQSLTLAEPSRTDRVQQRCVQWMRSNAGVMWPRSTGGGYPSSFPDVFDPSLLVAPDDPDSSADRIRLQYYRANVEPTDLYVVSLARSTKHRLWPGHSGFTNLYLAGDWTQNGINYGCVEAAVMSGMLASRAISGFPKVIFGENFPAS